MPGPIRAITSTLSARAAPPVPPAKDTYELLAKAVLRHRLVRHTFLWSLSATWLGTATWVAWSKGRSSLKIPVEVLSLGTIVFTVATWTVAIIPVVVLRNRYITVDSSSGPSPSQTFNAARSKRSTVHAWITYLASATAMLAIHALLSHVYEAPTSGSPRLSLFVKSKKHPYYLNGALLYLFWSQLVLASAYLMRDILLGRFVLRWHHKAHSSDKGTLRNYRLAYGLTALASLLLFTLLCTTCGTVMFGLIRSIALPILYMLPIIPRLLKPFTAHFLRGTWTVFLFPRQLALVRRAFYLGVTTAALWESVESPYNENVSVAEASADPVVTLISGATSPDPFFKQLAYTELRELAADDSQTASSRRSALFADQKYHPNLWTTLVRDALLTLGTDYQLLLRRGKPADPAATPATPANKAPPPPAEPISLIRGSVLKTSTSSPLRAAVDTLASDGPLSTAMASTEETASQIPELFRSVLPIHPPLEVAAQTVKKSEEKVLGLLEQAKSVVQQPLAPKILLHIPPAVLNPAKEVREWWTRERVNKVAEMVLPHRYLDALIIDTLSHLVSASLTEDLFGVVQRDIPKILEGLLSLLTAVEDYQAELSALYTPPSAEEVESMSAGELLAKERAREEVARAGECLSVVNDALKDGVALIVRTFGEKLTAFKFPTRIARKLQGFVDYT